MRRLPVYLLVDTSESTVGAAHDSIKEGLRQLVSALHKDPYALETVWLSVITFDVNARVLTPLTDISEFMFPDFQIQPGTALGAALDLLREQIAKETVRTTRVRKGDWRPLVFLLTDGAPTDEWREPLARLKRVTPKPANIYAIGCGDDVDFSILQELADFTFQLESKSEAETSALFKKLFIWLSASVNSASRGFEDNPVEVDRLPDGVRKLERDFTPNWREDYPSRIFMHAMCTKTKKKTLLRFNYDGKRYSSSDVFPLHGNFLFHGAGAAAPVPTELITADVPICPHCGGFLALVCPRCGCIICLKPPYPDEVECPNCHNVAGLGGGVALDSISGSTG